MNADDRSAVLRTLRDLPGIVGSFVCDGDGKLLCRDLPAYFDDLSLSDVGPRASRILETWSAEIEDAECVVRFDQHKVYMRGLERALLCVVVGHDVHVPSMRTAAGMVARRLNAMWQSSAPISHSGTQVEAAAHGSDPRGGNADPGGPRSSRSADPTPAAEPAPAAPRAESTRPARAAPPGGGRARPRIYRGQRFDP